MKRILAVATVWALAGCDGNPLSQGGGGGPDPEDTCSGQQVCSGDVNRFTYDATNDRVLINNLPFDLDGTYLRAPSLDRGSFRAYVNQAGDEQYVALFGRTADSQAGVVGTGGYLGFGYGGSMFTSGGSTNFPGNGEAVYVGDYAGVRVYEGGGIGYADGSIRMRVDFEDFDEVGAIDTVVTNRRGYDETGAFIGDLPSLSGTTTGFNGDRVKQTPIVENLGGGATGAAGTLDGMFGGAGADEVAGVIVIEGADALGSGLAVRERGAFIADRISFIRP